MYFIKIQFEIIREIYVFPRFVMNKEMHVRNLTGNKVNKEIRNKFM